MCSSDLAFHHEHQPGCRRPEQVCGAQLLHDFKAPKRGEPKSIKNFINKADFKRLSNHFGVNYVYLFEDDKCFFSPIYCETKKLKFDLLEKYKFDE